MKLLSDKDALEKLYGKISIGFLLVQDLIAIIILITISTFLNQTIYFNKFIFVFIKSIAIFIPLLGFGYFILPKINFFLAKSQEFLFIFAIAWGLGLAAIFSYAGFSIEVGAFIAGIMLSSAPYSFEISSKLKPLRDFFIISFFILLGSQMVFGDMTGLIIPVIILSLFILIGNPIIVMILMGFFGYSKKTSFMAGLTVAQISEFSLILIMLGFKIGHLSRDILSFVTAIGLITIAGSTYMIMYSEKIYSILSKPLSIFERKKIKESMEEGKIYDYILFGENRTGFSIMKYFIKSNKRYLIVDFNPERVKKLNSLGINCIYGDASDSNFLENIKLEKAKIVVSTITDIETNIMLIKKIKDKNKEAIIILAANRVSDALILYNYGADYVILPHLLGGKYIADLIEKADLDKKLYQKEKKEHLKELEERIKIKPDNLT